MADSSPNIHKKRGLGRSLSDVATALWCNAGRLLGGFTTSNPPASGDIEYKRPALTESRLMEGSIWAEEMSRRRTHYESSARHTVMIDLGEGGEWNGHTLDDYLCLYRGAMFGVTKT